MIRWFRRYVWFYIRIARNRLLWHQETARTAETPVEADRRFPIPPSQAHRYARAADEMFYAPANPARSAAAAPVPRTLVGRPHPQQIPLS